MRTHTASWIVLGLAAALAAGGCDFSDDPVAASLGFVRPVDGARITLADDEADADDGIQYTITLESSGLSSADAVTVLLDGDALAGPSTPDDDGTIEFTGVTLPPGTHELTAEARGGGVVAEPVDITVVSACATINFVDPAPTDATTLTLGPADDDDGARCGDAFAVNVTVATDAGDGSTMTIYVNGSAAGTATVNGTVAVFEAVELDASGATNELEVSVENADGVTCDALFPNDVVVDCSGFSCGNLQFLTPEPDPEGDPITLGPDQDEDGEACGTTYTVTVTVATDVGDGQEMTLFVNDTPRDTATVTGNVAVFDDVVLDNRGDTPNTMSVSVENLEGETCEGDFDGDVYVDCAGASCNITDPDTATVFLNADEDDAADPGFQADVVVTTDAAGLGQDIDLIIDGDRDNVLTETPAAVGGGGEATFGAVDLDEGDRRVYAECRDASGNVTRSGEALWTVDITPCSIAIGGPAPDELIVPSMDSSADPGVQIEVSGVVGQADCAEIRIAQCSAIDSAAWEDMSDTDFAGEVTLSTSSSQELCVQVRDDAGNESEASVTIRYRSDEPQLEIDTGVVGGFYNLNGGMIGGETYTADAAIGTAACDIAVTVYCTEVGEDVDLYLDEDGDGDPATGTLTAVGTAPCEALGGEPAGYDGTALFDDSDGSHPFAILPTDVDSGALLATQTHDLLTGWSSAVALSFDCEAPVLGDITYSSNVDPLPACGASAGAGPTLNPPPGGVTIDVEVDVSSLDPVTLRVFNDSGGVVFEDEITPSGTSDPVLFDDVDLGGLTGAHRIVVIQGDTFGNSDTDTPAGGGADCWFQIDDVPSVLIGIPNDGGFVGADDDCDVGAPGFQMEVSGYTDAAIGTAVDVTVGLGGSATTESGLVVDRGGGAEGFYFCMDVPQGDDLPVSVEITDARGTGSETVSVSIDTVAPPLGILNLAVASVPDRRAGVVQFSWTAVGDSDGSTLASYEMRCATFPITDETTWNAPGADTYPVATTPGALGAAQLEAIGGFRAYDTRYCSIRGEDEGGQQTPVSPSSTTVSFEWTTPEELTGPVGLNYQAGYGVEGVGDVSGDGIDDFLIGGDGVVGLVLGEAGSVPTTVTTVITGPTGWSGGAGALFGSVMASAGDFNNDGINDLALSAYAELGGFYGRVYVVFGHDHAGADPWPASVDISTCDGSWGLCFSPEDWYTGGAGSFSEFDVLYLGFSLAGIGDFNDDGFDDLAVAATVDPIGFTDTTAIILLGGDTGAGDRYDVAANLLSGDFLVTGLASDVHNPALGASADGFVVADDPEGVGGVYFNLGYGLAGLGNIDGVAGADLAISTPVDAGHATGYVVGLSGRAHGGPGTGFEQLDSSTELTVITSNTDGTFGLALHALGDVDGDGVQDLGVSNATWLTARTAPPPPDPAPPNGNVYVIFMDGAGFTSSDELKISVDSGSDPDNDGFGFSVGHGWTPAGGLGGDLDGDGRADLVVGSIERHAAGTRGAGSLFYGDSSWPADPDGSISDDAAAAVFQPTSTESGYVPRFVAHVGDVNNDGHPDCVVGDPRESGDDGRFFIHY